MKEQIRRYNARDTAIVARRLPNHKIVIGQAPSVKLKMATAKRLDIVIERHGLTSGHRLPRGFMIEFFKHHVCFTNGTGKQQRPYRLKIIRMCAGGTQRWIVRPQWRQKAY